MTATETTPLGTYLRDRRIRLDPASMGISPGRRRTPGLRREEVAQRAGISTTWYTWLEQGRGGAASEAVLDRIAHALMLTDVEREHVFLLGLGRTPEVHYRPVEGISPRLQRVLDAFGTAPAMIRTATWDIVAWNRAASVVLTDYGALPPEERNVLRMMFLRPETRAAQYDWESVARYVVAVFRADSTRAGAAERSRELAEALCRESPEFERMWKDNDVQDFGAGEKRLKHPNLGLIALEYSTFAVDGRPELGLVVYNPIGRGVPERIQALMDSA